MEIKGVDGTVLTCDVTGADHPLVLIHGSWGERQTWGLVVPALAESFRVISYDRRGHGESTAPPDVGTVHDDVADAVVVIDALADGRANVVANSYGACIALRLAAAHPERVARMVCHEPPMLGVLEADDEGKAIADEERRKLGEVRQILERGEYTEAAEYFVERVALGPGMWSELPPPLQQMFVKHAPTFLGELPGRRGPRRPRSGLTETSQGSRPPDSRRAESGILRTDRRSAGTAASGRQAAAAYWYRTCAPHDASGRVHAGDTRFPDGAGPLTSAS